MSEQVCPVCQIKIVKSPGGDKVLFSSGAPGTRSKLWARVCQFTQNPGCINKDRDSIGEIKSNDYYRPNVEST